MARPSQHISCLKYLRNRGNIGLQSRVVGRREGCGAISQCLHKFDNFVGDLLTVVLEGLPDVSYAVPEVLHLLHDVDLSGLLVARNSHTPTE